MNRPDYILPNYALGGGFWQFMRTHYEAHLIVAEVKNLSHGPGKAEILQVANYLNPRGTGLVDLVLARRGFDQTAPVDLPGAVGSTASSSWASAAKTSRQILIASALEACDGPPPVNSLPFFEAPPNAWAVTYDRLMAGLDAEEARIALETTRGPLTAFIDYKFQPGSPARDRGAGLHPFAFVPRLELIALFALRPETPALRHVLVDDNGPALVSRLWRGFFIHDGSYTPLEPAVHGSDLLIRPNLYDILESTMGEATLSLSVTISHYEP